MKPHKPKPKKRAAQRAVRRLVQAKLSWLRGFPTGPSEDGQIPWRLVPGADGGPSHDLIVDRARIREASVALGSIVRRFPHALPQLVGDVATWRASFVCRLELLKGAIHCDEPLPDL